MMPNQRFNEMLHLSGRRGSGVIVGAGCAIAVICWYFGVNVWHAVMLGCAIMVIALALLVAISGRGAVDFSWRPGKRARRAGSRTEVANLASSLHGGGWSFVGLTAEQQLQHIARRRVALEGLDLNNTEHRSAIESRIGVEGYGVLVRSGGRVPTLDALLDCLDALDAIDSTHYPVPQPHARRGGLAGIPFNLGRARER
jgi:hypothetical protein